MNLLQSVRSRSVNVIHGVKALSLRSKAVILIVILLVAWFGIKPLINGQQKKISYQTAQAEKGTLITSVTASGTVTSGSTANITSAAKGIVKEVYVQNGDTVIQGGRIAFISPDVDSQQQQAAAYASYLAAQNTLNTARAKKNSLQAALFVANQNFVNGAGTQNPITDDPNYVIQRANWLQAESDYKNQDAIIAQAEIALSAASLSNQQLSPIITAPISGVVSNLALTPGMTIGNSTSSSTSDNDSSTSPEVLGAITLEEGKPQATVNLSEIDVTKVTTDQKVTVTLDAFPDKTFTGKVVAINTNGTSSSGVTSYPVTITFDTSPSNMYPNMAVSAIIITDIKNDVLLVPSTAVQTTNGIAVVRVMKGSVITSKEVEVGGSNDTLTEILSGIDAGETVVTGQTGSATDTVTGSQNASPFGGSGLGGGRGFSGGGNAIRIRQ